MVLSALRGTMTRRRLNPHEVEERIELCVKLLRMGAYTGDIKRAIAAKYGCSTRSVEVPISRAREILVAESGRSREEHRAESLAFYSRMKGDDKAKDRDRLLAQERIDKLLGLESPNKTELSGPGGAPLGLSVSMESVVASVQQVEEYRRARLPSHVPAPGHNGA